MSSQRFPLDLEILLLLKLLLNMQFPTTILSSFAFIYIKVHMDVVINRKEPGDHHTVHVLGTCWSELGVAPTRASLAQWQHRDFTVTVSDSATG